MIKKIILFCMVLFFSSCVIITVKENHIHIHDNTAPVVNEAPISGSDPSGNDVSPEIDIPLVP